MQAGSKSFPRSARLTTRADFRRALAEGRRLVDARLSLCVIGNDLGHSRLGTIVGRRFGNAPRRNRFKRLVREAFRLQRANLPVGFDLVCAPRGGGPATLREAVESLTDLVRRAVSR